MTIEHLSEAEKTRLRLYREEMEFGRRVTAAVASRYGCVINEIENNEVAAAELKRLIEQDRALLAQVHVWAMLRMLQQDVAREACGGGEPGGSSLAMGQN